MLVTQKTINDLTLNQLYTVKWGTLQHTPDYIQVSTISGNNATVGYYDSTGTTLQFTRTQLITDVVFLIDLTS